MTARDREVAVLAKWPIRDKLLIGIGLLAAIVVTLSVSSFVSVYAYRSLVRSLRNRADELPLATELAGRVSDLLVSFTATQPLRESPGRSPDPPDAQRLVQQFDESREAVKTALDDYCNQLSINDQEDMPIGNNRQEQAEVVQLRDSLAAIAQLTIDPSWPLDQKLAGQVNDKLKLVQSLSAGLPGHFHRRIHDLAGEVSTRYRTLIILTWIVAVAALTTFGLFIHLFYRWVFRPLRVLIKGSRFVAAGNFGHRIHLDTHDEMAELAGAMNDMTARFQAIRDDLDRQVQVRTKQVVR